MGRFAGFANNEESIVEDPSFLNQEIFAKRIRIKKEQEEAKAKKQAQWETEFLKCNSIKTLRDYIRIYKDDRDNPYIDQAKEKLDDMSFMACVSKQDFKNYLSNFQQGKYRGKASAEINRLESIESSYSSSTTSSTFSSSDSSISWTDFWQFIKLFIAGIFIIGGVVITYLRITGDINSTFTVIGYWGCICGPVCKWAISRDD